MLHASLLTFSSPVGAARTTTPASATPSFCSAARRMRHMAADSLAPMGRLGWERARVPGRSLGGELLIS